MGKNANIQIKQLDEGFEIVLKTGRIRGTKKVGSDTLTGGLKKIIPKVGTFYGKRISLDDILEE